VTALAAPARAQTSGAYESHMSAGAKLVEEESWAAAEAEFEAAYKADPRAAPLVQMAACARALGRYPQAIAAIERALRDHAATMSVDEKKAAEQTLAEMRAELGAVQVTLAPKEATLRIDGEDLPREALAKPIPLGPGPHRLEARLEGYAPAAQTITIQGAGDIVAVKLGLVPDRGRVTIVAPDERTTIAIDESPVGAGTWSGLLTPGQHVVHVVQPNGLAWAMTITVVAGKAIEARPAQEGQRSAPPSPPAKRGFYVLGAATVFFPIAPSDFSSGTSFGFSGGVRGGYRVAPIFGAELSLEYAHAGASGQGKPSFADTPNASYPMSYSLSSFRAGVHARLMTTGQRMRFVQTFGGGLMVDSISWKADKNVIDRQGASGLDGFGASETGFEVDLNGVLLGLAAQALLGSSGALTLPKHDKFSAETFGGPQFSIGLGLRGGYRLW
jgi:hypothetical protein